MGLEIFQTFPGIFFILQSEIFHPAFLAALHLHTHIIKTATTLSGIWSSIS